MYITHNDEEIPTGTLKQLGIIQANYKLLVEMFGEPRILNQDCLHVEWVVRVGDKIAAINNYIGVTKPTVENTALWPIAGSEPDVINDIRQILDNPIASIKRKIEFEMSLVDANEKEELLKKCARNLEQMCKATTILCKSAETALAQMKKII
jgi:hypothetical protein